MDNNKLIVTAAPHITSTDTTQKIMQRVCLALLPTLIASVIIFGITPDPGGCDRGGLRLL